MITANSLKAPQPAGREPLQTPAQVEAAALDLAERMAKECGADRLPMSAALRNVLAVVEELEAHGLTVNSLDMPFADEPSIGIEAGPDLEGDESGRFLAEMINGPLMESRTMTYRGVLIEWTFPVEEAAHG
jgi:hypothetical protein